MVTVVEIDGDARTKFGTNDVGNKKEEKQGSQNWQAVTETVAIPHVSDINHDTYINISILDKAKVPELADGAVSKTVAIPHGVGVRTSMSGFPLLGVQNSVPKTSDFMLKKIKIKDIKVGDYVLSLNEKTKKQTLVIGARE